MMLGIKKFPYEVFIVLIGILLAVGIFGIIGPEVYLNAHYTGGDAQGYLEAGDYLWNKGNLHYFRTFGYPLITGIPIRLGLDDSTTILVLVWINFSFFITSAVLVYRLVICITNWKKLGLIMALLFMFSPGLLFTNLATLSEPLFILVVLLALSCLKDYVLHQRSRSLVYFNLLLLFSAAVRPINLYFSVVAAIISILVFFRKKESFGNTLLVISGVCLFVFMPLGLMKKTYGVSTYTFNSRYMLYHYICSYASSIPNSSQIAMYDSFHRRVLILDASNNNIKAEEINWRQRDSFYESEIGKVIRGKTKQLLVAYVKNYFENSSTGSHLIPREKELRVFPHLEKIFSTITIYENVIFSIMAILVMSITMVLFLFRKWKSRIRIDIILVVIALQIANLIALSSLSFWQGDRFSIVYYPLLLVAFPILIWILKTDGRQNSVNNL